MLVVLVQGCFKTCYTGETIPSQFLTPTYIAVEVATNSKSGHKIKN